jgi:anti-anti-sigma regulatory factor
VIELTADGSTAQSASYARLLAAAVEARVDIVLDLARVARMDSVLLWAIVSAAKGARAVDRRFGVRGLHGDAERVLMRTGLLSRLESP